MSDRLFPRGIKITIVKPNGFFTQDTNAIEVTNLRAQFSIEKNLQKEPNKCDITITNLAKHTRAELQKKPLYIRIDAGYDGELKRLFAGDLRYAPSTRSGVDITTKLQVADGDRAFKFARVNKSFKAGVTSKDALKELSKQMGLKFPENGYEAKLLLKQYASGMSLSGRAETQMTNILKPKGLGWSVQDGRLQILGHQNTRPDQAYVISSESGMIGSPQFGDPPDKGKKSAPILKIKNLLFPELTPGGKIKVISEDVNGVFRIEKLVHTGDTHGNDWYTDIEAKAI